MTTTPEDPLSDEDLTSSGDLAATETAPTDADGTDGGDADGTDADGTDGTDGSTADADGTDGAAL